MIFRPKTSSELIAAIEEANNLGGNHTIQLVRKKYILDSVQAPDPENPPRGASGLPQITCNLTIEGNGATLERLSSSLNFRFFYILSTATLDLRDLNITGGYLYGDWVLGGAIRNFGTLNLFGCNFRNNRVFGTPNNANYAYGGAILNELYAQLNMTEVSIIACVGYNGAIFNTGNLVADACIFLSNVSVSADGQHGAAGCLYNAPGGDVIIQHSLFEGNVAANGGAIRNDGDLTVNYCDFTKNHADFDGSAIYVPYLPNYPLIEINANEFYDNDSTSLSCVYNHPYNTTYPLNAESNWWGASDGPSGNGLGSGESVSTNVDFTPFNTQPIAPSCDGDAYCRGVNYAADDMVATNNPISLRLGEKRLEVTDLSLNTPAGLLAFTRTFRQSKINVTPLTGLGWSHNHYVSLSLTGTTPNRVANMNLPNGGILVLDEVTSPSGHFEGTTGSTCALDYVAAPNEFILTTQNEDQYIFEPISGGSTTEYRLRMHSRNSGETWTYHYFAGSDHLQRVEDTYGNQLQFSYRPTINDPFDAAQLWRVGDRYATDLDGTNPSGNYIEFTYEPESIDGQPLQTPRPLLATVRDVRGYNWTYRYYGQESGEQTTSFANFMTRRLSPSVDITGDGIADEQLILERITYPSSSAIVQERGILTSTPTSPLLTTAFDFSGDLSTTATIDGRVTTHHFNKGMYAGAETSAGYAHQSHNSQFRPTSQVDANGNPTLLNWSGDGRNLEKVTDAEGHITSFAYNTDATLSESVDAEGRRTLYLYSPTSPRQPRLMVVVEGEEITLNGNMEVDSGWSNIAGASPQVNQQTPSHVYRGNYSRYGAAASLNQGIESNPWNLIANQLCTITARVYVVAGQVKMQVPGVASLDRFTSLSGTWQTLTATYTPASAQNGLRLQLVANQANTHFYVDSVSIYQDTVGELAVNGDMETSGDWTDISGQAPQVNIQSPLHADTGQYARYVEAASADQGIESIAWDLEADQSYTILARVLVMSGAVKMQVPGVTAFDRTTSITGTWQTLLVSYEPTSAQASRHLQFVAAQANTQFYVDSVIVLRGTMLQVQEFSYDAKDRVLAEHQINPADGTVIREVTHSYYPANDANMGARGMLQTLTQRDMGGSNDVSTTYFYDSYGRVVQTNQNSTFGSCTRSYTVYDAAGNGVASICNYENAGAAPTTAAEAVALYNSAYPDRNRVTTHAYDQLGRHIQTTVNAGSSEALTTLTVYDALNRVVRTVSNFVAATAPASPYTATHSAFSNHGSDNTQNLVADTAYNARGLVESQTDGLGNVSRYVYDDAGRPVKVIQNYVSNGVDPTLWVWNNNRWENGSGAAISHGMNNDQNLISASEYDTNSNPIQTRDVLGQLNRTVYDALNRVVKTVRNWQSSGTGYTTDPTTWVWDSVQSRWEDAAGQPILFGSSNDQNLVTQTNYDAMGRVVHTQDETGEWTLFGYDPLGRQVRVIRNASNPIYDLVADPDLDQYEIPPNGNPDQDILTTTVYDAQGRVDYTVDVNGSQTKFVYDGLGRQVKVIQNYIAQGSSDPAAWVWDSADQRWERGASDNTAIVHGSNQDQNIIALTNYDTDGRVRWTQDVLGRKTWHVYDSVGREIKTIVNCTYNGTGTTPEDPAYTGSPDSDKDVITQRAYDAFGRVSASMDARGNETRYFYNKLGRRTRTIANYVAQGSSNPATWVWDDTPGQNRWEQSDGTPISHGVNNDENLISEPTYDLAGRVISSRDPSGKMMRQVYDQANRRIRTVANYLAQGTPDPLPWLWDDTDKRWEDGSGNAISHGADFDLNLISDTVYNLAGQVVATRDVRGTRTGFVYDGLSRRTQVVQAEGSPLASKAYTAYDKGGRVARSVRNWQSGATTHNIDPLTWAWNATLQRWEDNGNPVKSIQHGVMNDQNLPILYTVDKLGRVVSMTSPAGGITSTAYYKDGRVENNIDAAGVVTTNRYDQLRRLTRVVQGYQATGADPSTWLWNETHLRWEDAWGTPILHGVAQDQNIIVSLMLDLAGRQTSLRDGRGFLTTYAYDQLNRRLGLTNPLSGEWTTAYADVGNVAQVTTTDPLTQQIRQEFDRLGRLAAIHYLGETTPKATPDVTFSYDLAGNRTLMSESDGVNTVRRTEYSYDAARRLTTVGFDTNGDTTVEQTVEYTYDIRGLRTQLTLPGNLSIGYVYDERGQLVGLSDWDNQTTQYAYDQTGRLVSVARDNGLVSRYGYDPASRLTNLHHTLNNRSLGAFAYEVDARGNRVQALEALPSPNAGNTLITSSDGAVDYYQGEWVANGNFMESIEVEAKLRIAFFGRTLNLTLGVGPNHSICDVYVDETFWGSLDNYAGTAGEETVTLTLQDEGLHILDIRNTVDRHPNSGGWLLQFRQISVDRLYSLHTVDYAYDALARLEETNYLPARHRSAAPFRHYNFSYDTAGNRRRQVTADQTSADRTRYWYDEGNQVEASHADQPTFDVSPDNVPELITAILAANNAPGGGIIRLTPGSTYHLRAVDNTTEGPNALPVISGTVTIEGQGAKLIRDADAPNCRIFTVVTGGSLTLQDLEATGGIAEVSGAAGGGIRNSGTLTLERCTLSHHLSYRGAGGILNLGTLVANDSHIVDNLQIHLEGGGGGIQSGPSSTTTLINCVIANNASINAGGGCLLQGNTILTDCTITHNRAIGEGLNNSGGGIYLDGNGVLTMTNSMLSHNQADTNGGGLMVSYNQTCTITNSRIAHNSATGSGAAVYAYAGGNVTLHNNWIVGNFDPTAPTAEAVFNVDGNNLLDADTNWWGAADGPSGAAPGSGDSVNGNVSYANFYTAASQVVTYTYTPPTDTPPLGATEYDYDAAGRLLDDGTLTYTWDRASRLLSAGGSSYTYNGLGQRIAQTVGANMTAYLLDVQPGLYKVLAATTGVAVDRFVQGPTGIQAQQDSSSNWEWMLQDGLGSVRSVLDNSVGVLQMNHYAPYGEVWGGQGTAQTPFGFTGEPTDTNGLVHLRARYYNPALGVFPSLDPLEGSPMQPAGLNRYAYVQGNPINWIDPSGLAPTAGCGNKTCDDLLQEMYNAIHGFWNKAKIWVEGLVEHYGPMLEDLCRLFDRDRLGVPRADWLKLVALRPNCRLTDTTWQGHLDEFDNAQNPLDQAIKCYESRGQQLANAPEPYKDTSRLCDRNNPTYVASLEWSSRKMKSGNFQPRLHGGQEAPPLPAAPISVSAALNWRPSSTVTVNSCPSCQVITPQDLMTPASSPQISESSSGEECPTCHYLPIGPLDLRSQVPTPLAAYLLPFVLVGGVCVTASPLPEDPLWWWLVGGVATQAATN